MQNELKFKIELKKLSINLRMSEETTMFIADLYIDGVKVGEARNDGHGGSTFYRSFTDEGRQTIRKVEAYFATLPEVEETYGGGSTETFMHQPTLESHIDELVEAESVRKQYAQFAKKTQKDCEKLICYGTEAGYRTVGWKNRTIAEVLALPKGADMLRDAIKTVKSRLQEGERILNTNIPTEILA